MKISQFLLTRFNCRVGYASADLGIDEQWLAQRFVLFENFCLPSVRAQDHQDFFWIILIDERTPAPWVAKLEDVLGDMRDRVVIKPVKRFSGIKIVREIKKRAVHQSEIIVTTRLDNDDAIARNFMSSIISICRSLTPDRNYVINYSNGCQVHKSGVYAFNPTYLNPFLSVMSVPGNLKTAFHTRHSNMGCVGTIVNIAPQEHEPDSIMWMQVIHSTNARNRVRKQSKKIRKERIKNFPIAPNWQTVLKTSG